MNEVGNRAIDAHYCGDQITAVYNSVCFGVRKRSKFIVTRLSILLTVHQHPANDSANLAPFRTYHESSLLLSRSGTCLVPSRLSVSYERNASVLGAGGNRLDFPPSHHPSLSSAALLSLILIGDKRDDWGRVSSGTLTRAAITHSV